MPVQVTVDNFVRAECDRMFTALQSEAGGVNVLRHHRTPTPLDEQTVIRMNRDTLYSFAIVDVAAGATLTIPESGDRYVSAMILNQDHYVNRLFHDAGEHELEPADCETPWIIVGIRVLVDPEDSDDVAAVNALQDRFRIVARSAKPFAAPSYDQATLDATRTAVLELAKHAGHFDHAFGARNEVDPIRHLIGTAAGFGGLPDREARYLSVVPEDASDEYEVVVRDVPVDGFWSVTVYDADGFLRPNDRGAYSVNNITATPDDDGSVTIHFGGCDDERPNCLPIADGWNYTVRLYRPRSEVLDGSWTFPALEPARGRGVAHGV
jgi:hypothetical protein